MNSSEPLGSRFPHIFALGAGLGAALALVAGCSSGMEQIDRRVAEVLGESAAGASLTSGPRLAPAGELPTRRSSLFDENPQTTNPPPDALAFTPFDRGEGVEVVEGLSERLQSFARSAAGIGAPNVMQLSLTDSLRTAQRSGPEYLAAEEDYVLDAIALLVERHRWGPRLFNDTTITASGEGDDGRFDNTLELVNTLRATQRLPYGGDVEARWVWNATEQLRSSVSDQYQQSSRLVLSGDVPLLRGSGQVAREDRIQRERNLVYAAREFEDFRREYFVSIAQDYFELIQAINELQNRVRQIRSLEVFVVGEQARFDAERRSAFELNEARNRLITARSQMASAREQYTLQVDRFKVRLGVPVEDPVQMVAATIDVPEPSTTIEDATVSALAYRLDLQNQRDRFDDSERGVLNARDNMRADLDLSGSLTLPTDPDASEGGLVLDPEELSWETSIMLSLPLDRRIERLQLRDALVRLERSRRNLDEFTDNVVLEARRRVREIDLARFRLELADAAVDINLQRLEELRIKVDETDVRERLDAETELLDAENDRAQALTDLRVAVLNYLESIGQLRVSADGTIAPIPGMEVRIEDTPIDFEQLFADEISEEELQMEIERQRQRYEANDDDTDSADESDG